MPNIEQQLYDLNSRLNQYSQLLDTTILDPDLSKWDKLLLIMHFGVRVTLINAEIKKLQYLINPLEPMTANALAKLQAIKNTALPAENLLATQSNFFDFAESVYILNELNLLKCAVQHGARLNFNSFFKGIYDTYCNIPDFAELMQTLYTLVYDISSESMPWEGSNKYAPSLRCNAYLNGTIRLNINTFAQPVFYAAPPEQLVQYYMPSEAFYTVMPIARLDPVMQGSYKAEPAIVSMQPATVPVKLAPAYTSPATDTQQTVDLVPIFSELSIAEVKSAAAPIESENNIEELADVKTEVPTAATTSVPAPIENPIAKAIRLCDSTTCNVMLNDPQQSTALFNELIYNISVVFTGKAKQLEFINELQLTFPQLLSLVEISQLRSAFKVAICRKILNFEDKVLYETLHEKNKGDILGSLGQHLNANKADEKSIKQILRKRLNEYLIKITRESVEAAKAIEIAKAAEAASSTQTIKSATNTENSTTAQPSQSYNTNEIIAKSQKSKKTKVKKRNQQQEEQDELEFLPLASNIDLIKIAIKNNDYQTINNFLFPSEEETKQSLIATVMAFRDSSNTFTDEFLENIDISHTHMIGIILVENVTKQIARIFLSRIVKFNDELFFVHNIKVNFVLLFDAIFKGSLSEDEISLRASIEYKTHSVNAQACLEYKNILDQLQTSEPGAHLDINSYVYAANINSKTPDTNDLDPKTILMSAIEKKIDIEQIILLAKNSAFTITSLDFNSKNIFHYWAQYQTADSSRSIEHIWEKYSHVTEGSTDAFELIAACCNDTGDTFMHTLIKNNDPQQIAVALNALLPQSLNLTTGAPSAPATSNALGCALFKVDKLNKIPLDYIEELEKHEPNIEIKMIGVICMLCLLTVETAVTLGGNFFPTNRPFFGANVLANITKLLIIRDYDRILHLITLHQAIRHALQQVDLQAFFAHLPPNQLNNAAILRNAILKNLGKSELEYMIGDKPVHLILNEEAIKPGNSELLENMQRELFKSGEKQLQIRHTLAWLRVNQHLKNTGTALSSDELNKCIKQLKPRVNIKDVDSQSFAIDYAISSTNLPMVKFLYKDCRAKILPQVVFTSIMFAFGNADGNVADLKSSKAVIVNFLFDNFKENCSNADLETVSSNAYEYATVTKDINLVKILNDNYKLKINPRTLLNAILFAFDNKDGNVPDLNSPSAALAHYIFKKSKIEENDLELARLNATLYEIALQNPLNIQLLSWMIDNDFTFDIEYTHGKKINLFQTLIANADANNIKDIVQLLKGMLDEPINVKELLDSKDPQGCTFIYLLFSAAMKQVLNHNDLNKIIELCLNQKANFIDIGLANGNTLHLASMLNNHSLVALIIDKVPEKDLITMLRTTNSNGKNIVDCVDAMVKIGKCDISIHNLLDAKYKEVVLKKLLNVMENTAPLQSVRPKP